MHALDIHTCMHCTHICVDVSVGSLLLYSLLVFATSCCGHSVEQVVGLDVEVTESKEKITFLQQERTELISKVNIHAVVSASAVAHSTLA